MQEPEIGDEFEVVIVHPNTGTTNDPVAKVNGKTTFIRFPKKDDGDVEFGDEYRVKMADKREEHNMAVVVGEVDDG